MFAKILLSQGANGEDDDIPARPEDHLAEGSDSVDRGGFNDDRELIVHEGLEIGICASAAERRQFLRPLRDDIIDGGDLDAPGVCGDDMPDVAAAEQPYFYHRIKKL